MSPTVISDTRDNWSIAGGVVIKKTIPTITALKITRRPRATPMQSSFDGHSRYLNRLQKRKARVIATVRSPRMLHENRCRSQRPVESSATSPHQGFKQLVSW